MGTEITEMAEVTELNDRQERLRHQLGYMGMVAKRDTIYEARNDAVRLIEGASTPSDAMTATFMLYNTVVHELAKRCVPLGRNNTTKGELVDMMFNGSGIEIDTARPQTWDDAVRPLGIDPHEYVWAYSKEVGSKYYMGAPLHLGQEMMNRILGLE